MTAGLPLVFMPLRKLLGLAVLLGLALALGACTLGGGKENHPLSQEVKDRLAAMGSSPGEAMMVRIFKQSSELEVWKRTRGGEFKLFNTYEICAWSGDLGPKIKEGDRQSPEGFYTITPALMNPKSSYYLSFNTGFPNKFDRAYNRTGSDLMVHGDCSSRGCYAMTDRAIAEIYALARESFRGGNSSFQLQIYPFRMTAANLAKVGGNANLAFWNNIKEGYDQFEMTRRPPNWDVCDRRYVFNARWTGGDLDPVAACPPLASDGAPTAIVAQDAQSAGAAPVAQPAAEPAPAMVAAATAPVEMAGAVADAPIPATQPVRD